MAGDPATTGAAGAEFVWDWDGDADAHYVGRTLLHQMFVCPPPPYAPPPPPSEGATADGASFGISIITNICICTGVMLLFTHLRKNKWLEIIYRPKFLIQRDEIADGKMKGGDPIDGVIPKLPSKGYPLKWAVTLMNLKEDEVRACAGLDAVAFLRLFSFGLDVFKLYCIFGLGIILIVNVTANNRELKADEDTWDNWLSMANIESKSHRMWAHLICMYIFTMITMKTCEKYTKAMFNMRMDQLTKHPEPPGEVFSVLVTDIPDPKEDEFGITVDPTKMAKQGVKLAKSALKTLSAAVKGKAVGGKATEKYVRDEFEELFGRDEVLDVVMVPDVSDVDSLYQKVTGLRLKVERLEYDRENFKGRFGIIKPWEIGREVTPEKSAENLKKLEAVLLEEKGKLEESEAELVKLQAEALERPARSAFVVFASRITASTASTVVLHGDQSQWKVQPAPGPDEVFWQNIGLRWWERKGRQAIVAAGVAWLCIWFQIPQAAIQSVTNLEQLDKWFKVKDNLPTVVLAFLEGFLPGAAMLILISLLPPVFGILAMRQGVVSMRLQDRSASAKFFQFMVFAVFLGGAMANAIISQLSNFADEFSPTILIESLGKSVPSSSSFFITFIMIKCFVTLPVELLRFSGFVTLAKVHLLARTPDDKRNMWEPKPMDYVKNLPNAELIVLLGMVYATIAPLVIPFVIMYFVVATVVWRHQLMYVYKGRYEADGAIWMHILRRIVVCTVVAQVTVLGVFILKLGIAQTALMLPLVAMTLYFSAQLQDRYTRPFENIPRALAKSLRPPGREYILREAMYYPPCLESAGRKKIERSYSQASDTGTSFRDISLAMDYGGEGDVFYDAETASLASGVGNSPNRNQVLGGEV